MFTGIVQTTADVVSINKLHGLKQFGIAIKPEFCKNLISGASVAVNGVCLTVTEQRDDKVFFDVMEETLRVTNLDVVDEGHQVNIERSLSFGDEIGGHIVSGHIHTQAKVVSVKNTDDHFNLTLEVAPTWMKYILYKGFIAVNGCSLTIGKVENNTFELYLIPETLKLTNLSEAGLGTFLNIEIDSQTQSIVDTVERVLKTKELI
ncbi:riboflavin synthase subunit alpha [Parashewanella curva]|uniref:Riboflavin synthase n=1 Tax=Parashewanella curva TaxID=2338552 RepID=A0A3L8PTN1_9GAMM|nr:riboflavin synthase subunit alpha [Parashewanella curva]RLV57963.1 riboflavin synthase subunit alpha [Parashewanella curva]